MKYYSTGEFSKLIGKTPQTLRDWHRKEELLEDDTIPES